jgi:anti-sigma B factor antagonist
MATSPVEQQVPQLSLTASSANRRTTLSCAGKLVVATAETFRLEARRWSECSSVLIVDLGGLTYMDSAGLGAVVAAYTSAKNGGCEFQLENMTPRVTHLLQVTNLAKVLTPTTANLL